MKDEEYESAVDFSADSPTRGMIFPVEVGGKVVQPREPELKYQNVTPRNQKGEPQGYHSRPVCSRCHEYNVLKGRHYCRRCSDALVKEERP